MNPDHQLPAGPDSFHNEATLNGNLRIVTAKFDGKACCRSGVIYSPDASVGTMLLLHLRTLGALGACSDHGDIEGWQQRMQGCAFQQPVRYSCYARHGL
jgi:hypothetical protein